MQPMHQGQQAQVIVPQSQAQQAQPAPMGGFGAAALAKKFAAQGQSFHSPSDALVSPCTQKLRVSKAKHFVKGKPLLLNNKLTASNAGSNDQPSAPQQQQQQQQSAQGHTETDENTVQSSAADMSF